MGISRSNLLLAGLVLCAVGYCAAGLELSAAEPKKPESFLVRVSESSALEVVAITYDEPPPGKPCTWWLPNGKELPRQKWPKLSSAPAEQIVMSYQFFQPRECHVLLKETNIHGKLIVDPVGAAADHGRINEMVASTDFGADAAHSGYRVIRFGIADGDRFGFQLKIAAAGNWETIGQSTIEPNQAPGRLLDCSRFIRIVPLRRRSVLTKTSRGRWETVSVRFPKMEAGVNYAVPLASPRTCFRLVAVDRAGKEYSPTEFPTGVRGNWNDREAYGQSGFLEFPGLLFDDVAAVYLQARPIHVVELRDFAATPGIDATATIKHSIWTVDDARTEAKRLDARERGTVDFYICAKGEPVRVLRDVSDDLAIGDVLKEAGVDLARARARGDQVVLQVWTGYDSSATIPPSPVSPFFDGEYEETSLTDPELAAPGWERRRVGHFTRLQVPFKPKFVILEGSKDDFYDFERAVRAAVCSRFNDPRLVAQLSEVEKSFLAKSSSSAPEAKDSPDDMRAISMIFNNAVQRIETSDARQSGKPNPSDGNADATILARLVALRKDGVRIGEQRAIAVRHGRALLVTHFEATKTTSEWVPDAGSSAAYHFEKKDGAWRLAGVNRVSVEGVLLALCRLFSNVPTIDSPDGN